MSWSFCLLGVDCIAIMLASNPLNSDFSIDFSMCSFQGTCGWWRILAGPGAEPSKIGDFLGHVRPWNKAGFWFTVRFDMHCVHYGSFINDHRQASLTLLISKSSCCADAQIKSTFDKSFASKLLSMEIKGFEPLTPCLQGRCSPNWAIPP